MIKNKVIKDFGYLKCIVVGDKNEKKKNKIIKVFYVLRQGNVIIIVYVYCSLFRSLVKYVLFVWLNLLLYL